MDRVTYKPLSTNLDTYNFDDTNRVKLGESQQLEEVEAAEEEEEDDDDEEELFNRNSTSNLRGQHNSLTSILSLLACNGKRPKLNLKHLRLGLYFVVILLFLVFIAQLTQREPNRDARSISTLASPVSVAGSDSYKNILNVTNSITGDSQVPQYSSYLSSVLDEARNNFKLSTSNQANNFATNDNSGAPPDDLNFDETLSGRNETNFLGRQPIWWQLNSRDGDKYVTATNYVRAMKSFNYNSSITLTSQATTEFMYHSLELCKRWDGPISIAIFSPGSEMFIAITLIKFMRQCLPKPLSACIRDKVTWHVVYNKHNGPTTSSLSYPATHLDSTNYPLFVNQDLCPKFLGPEPEDLIKQFEVELKKVNGLEKRNYRQLFNLPYPINVLRNTARFAATTKYVLASDIELYPSVNLVPMFMNFINRHNIKREFGQTIEKFDFTLPIFEVKTNVSVPKTKPELIKLIQQDDAIFFHKWVCDACQNFPNRLDWLEQNTKLTNINFESDELSIFEITQRDKFKNSWEPIFIGTNDDPSYDDKLTWDGRRDKMSQMYEMCLLNYHHFILGNAFLVHAPGIKHIDKDDNKKRIRYIIENNTIYDATIAKLKIQYSSSPNLNKC